MSELVGMAIGETEQKPRYSTQDEPYAQLVLDTHASAMRNLAGERKAFDAAVRVWREHHPDASPEMARPAVATILSYKL